MSDDLSAHTSEDDTDPQRAYEEFRPLGTSPIGESFVIVCAPQDRESLEDDSDPNSRRIVLKKITEARLRSPERFRQKFAALYRLDHPGLCPYRDLYVGETATRITRDFVDGVQLDEFLLQPITEAESTELSRLTEESDTISEPRLDTSSPRDKESELSGTTSETTSSTTGDLADDRALQASETPKEELSPEENRDPKGTEASDEPQEERPEIVTSDEDDDFRTATSEAAPESPTSGEDYELGDDGGDDRPATLEIPASLLEDSDAADRALDLIILRLRRIIPQLVAALEYLHRFRHVHGHLTPSNILITDDERVILTDYGLYPELELSDRRDDGYASYHAPEVTTGEFSPQSDLYALGALLFEALADRPYRGAQYRREQGETDGRKTPVYLAEVAPHCPATWVELIHGLLASDPNDRPTLDDVTRQLAATETRSVSIPASVVEQEETLHGRNESLEHLAGVVQKCSRTQTMGIAMVEGETGVGKTAVLDALARRAAQRGWVILHGRCYHREPVAYQGWEEVIDSLVEIIDNLPDKPRRRLETDRRRAARLFPQLTPDQSPPTDISRRAAVDGFRRLLAQLSTQRPILIGFDDLHWAGHDSIRLLADLTESPAGMRLMIVATWRPEAADDDHPFWTELDTAPIAVERLPITGFSHEEAREYVLEHADHFTLRQKQEVLRRGGLNPLLIDELIHELDNPTDDDGFPEERDLSTEDGVAGVTGPTTEQDGLEDEEAEPPGGDDVDHHLRYFVKQRLSELSRAQRLVLQLLAIASAPLPSPLLTRALTRELGAQNNQSRSGGEVAQSLVEKRLARRSRSLANKHGGSIRYVVIHDLCRRVILEELGQDHHARLCGLIADALGAADDPFEDLRFQYLLRAGRLEEANRAAVLAARTAANRFAFHRATLLWRWLVDRGAIDDQDRPKMAESLIGAGYFGDAIEELERLLPAESQARDLRLRSDRLDAYLGLGDRSAAIRALDDALAAAGVSYLRPSMLDALLKAPRRLTSTIKRWADVVASATDQEPDERTSAKAKLIDLGLQAGPFLISDVADRLEIDFARIAARQRFAPMLARDRLSMIGSPWLPFLMRQSGKFERWCRQALTLVDEVDAPITRARGFEMKALLARHTGRVDQALKATEQAVELVESGRASEPLLHARLLYLEVDLHLWSGNLDVAGDLIARFTHRVRHRRWLQALARLASCRRALLVGDLDTAQLQIENIEQFVGQDRNCLLHLWVTSQRTRLDVALGRPEVAVAHWDLLLDRVYRRGVRKIPAARFLIHASMARALAALSERQRTLDEDRHRSSVARLRRTLRRLSDLEPWLGQFERAVLLRLRARYALLRRQPHKALTHVRKACNLGGDAQPPLLRALNDEAHGSVLEYLEHPEARPTLESARRVFDTVGVYLPLVLEGWPVPASNARLQPDP